MSHPPKVLFVSYGGGHIGMVLPVMRELEALLPGVQCPLMALTTGHHKAKAARPEALGYRDFLHLVDAGAARAWGERLSEGNTSPDVPRDETIAYLGINYLDLIAQHGEAGAADLYRQQGRYGFRPLHFMRKVMDALQPDAVVATNSPRSERTALDVAGERGLPAVGMVDLFGLDSDTYVLHAPKPAWTCVISEGVRQRLIARGFPPDGVVVTGNPAFDGLFSAHNHERAQRFLAERGWQDLKPVLFAGHWEPQAHPATPVPVGQALPREIEAVLRDCVQTRDDLALIVRYHPSDWTEYPRLPDEPRIHFSEPPREPIHPLILASEAVVVQTSTVGLESAVGGKPVISVENSPAAHVWFSLAQQGVSTPAATPSDLPQVLNAVLAGHGNPSDPSYRSDGLASRRVAAVVTKALAGRSAVA
ncbi:MAG: UDP-N-acetylglucosamine 2-epimerase [Hydrogenophaga sp.]|uniref:UDP-N-acetylglucosamine 2-epimerase n=1 Tax=Hydrogenophaga sp. TaxID=1904254 RepID=UPI003D9BEBA2